MFIEDFNFLDQYDVLAEENSEGNKSFKIRGVFSKCDTPNKNKRVYRRAIMEQAIGEIKPYIDKGGFVGELNHPAHPKVNMDRISHKVTKLDIAEDGSVVGEMVPAGPKKADLVSLLEDGIRVGVSTRGTGAVKPYNGPLGEGLVDVQPGYKLRAIDIVFDPSAGTFPEAVMEDTEYERREYLYVPNNFKAIWSDVFGK